MINKYMKKVERIRAKEFDTKKILRVKGFETRARRYI